MDVPVHAALRFHHVQPRAPRALGRHSPRGSVQRTAAVRARVRSLWANRLLVARYSADLQVPEGGDEVGTLAQRLAAAIDGEPLGGRALDPTYEVDLLPNDPAWDAHFVDRAAAHISPVADESRSFLAEGAAYIALLQPDHRLQFMFDIHAVFFPIAWIVGLVEGARYLAMSDEEFEARYGHLHWTSGGMGK